MGPASTSPPQYFCPACGAGLTDEDVMDGLALKRGQEVYCYKCFRKQFPGECINHPGSKATRRCSVCRRRLCENCVIELQGRQVCSRCKREVLAELERGPQARPKSFLDAPSPTFIFILGIMGVTFCGVLGIFALIGGIKYRQNVAWGLAPRNTLANVGLVLGVISTAILLLGVVLALLLG